MLSDLYLQCLSILTKYFNHLISLTNNPCLSLHIIEPYTEMLFCGPTYAKRYLFTYISLLIITCRDHARIQNPQNPESGIILNNFSRIFYKITLSLRGSRPGSAHPSVHGYRDWPCADPESFVRGGPTLTTFLGVCVFLVSKRR